MRIILLFIILYAIGQAYGQQDIQKEQNFKVKNLRTGLWDEFKFHIGLSLKFDVEFKIPIEDFNNDAYSISAILKDSLGNIVFDNESVNAILYAKPEKKEGSKYIDRGLYLFISGSEFKLPRGKNKLQLILNAKNGNITFNAIYNGDIEVVIPKYYSYEDQEFYITGYNVSEQSINGQKGIGIDFSTSYKFMSQQIRDFETNENSKYYFFYIEIKDAEGRTVYIPSEDINSYFLNEYEKLLGKDKNEKDQVSIFISYRKLNLKPGPQNLEVILNATDLNRSVSFKNLAIKKLKIIQPKIYFAELSIKKMNIKYGQYDLSSNLGRLFSKKSKNKGKGYPDVLWKIKTGHDEIYRSGIHQNSFSAYDDSCFFKLAEEDPIQIIVEDNDNLFNNDLIETYTINNSMGEFLSDYQGLSHGEIEHANIKFQKIHIPEFINKVITIDKTTRKNVTGYDLIIKYETLHSNHNLPIEIFPFFIDQRDYKNFIPYLRVINEEELMKSSQLIINKDDGLLNFFIPAYSFNFKGRFGYDTKIRDIQTNTYIHSEILNITDVNDIKFKILEIKDLKQNGTYGVMANIEYDIPAMYIYDIGYDNIQITTDFMMKSAEKSLGSIVRKSQKEKKESIGSSYFIPYYCIANVNEKLDIMLIIQALHKNFVIGSDIKYFSIPQARMANVVINNFSLKYKPTSDLYKKMKFQVFHDGELLGVTNSVTSSKKMWMGNKVPLQKIVHPYDDIVIRLVGITKFESEEIVDSWTIEAMRFADQKIKLAKQGAVKKLIINL